MKKKIVLLLAAMILAVSTTTGCLIDTSQLDQQQEESPVATETPVSSGEQEQESTSTEWTVPAPEGQGQILPSVADVVALVKPSVVSINTEVVTRDMFNRQFTQEGAGSGWIISEDGYIVTNNHVVEGARTVTVVLDNGTTVDAEIVGTDPLTDIAVVKIDSSGLQLKAVMVGNSEVLRVGDWVVAIGNSLGEGIRATVGIVSKQDAFIQVDQSDVLYNLIETDAAINPGNSGGPLVNMAGEVIGITNAKLVQQGVESVGYAISTETAVPVIDDLINLGRAIHPWLGVGLYTVDELVREQLSLQVDKGAIVTQVVPNSPASKAGLQEEDVIVSFAGEEIENVEDLVGAIRSAQVGQQVTITFWRGAEEMTTTTTLIERPSS